MFLVTLSGRAVCRWHLPRWLLDLKILGHIGGWGFIFWFGSLDRLILKGFCSLSLLVPLLGPIDDHKASILLRRLNLHSTNILAQQHQDRESWGHCNCGCLLQLSKIELHPSSGVFHCVPMYAQDRHVLLKSIFFLSTHLADTIIMSQPVSTSILAACPLCILSRGASGCRHSRPLRRKHLQTVPCLWPS